MAFLEGSAIGADICQALGIDYRDTCQIVINIKAADIATIAFKKYMVNTEGEKIGGTFWERYKLIPK